MSANPLAVIDRRPDDRAHGPDEKFHLPTFFRAIATCVVLLEETAALRPTGTAA